MGSPKRKPLEPWGLFKIRRKIENRLDKIRLRPKLKKQTIKIEKEERE